MRIAFAVCLLLGWGVRKLRSRAFPKSPEKQQLIPSERRAPSRVCLSEGAFVLPLAREAVSYRMAEEPGFLLQVQLAAAQPGGVLGGTPPYWAGLCPDCRQLCALSNASGIPCIGCAPSQRTPRALLRLPRCGSQYALRHALW